HFAGKRKRPGYEPGALRLSPHTRGAPSGTSVRGDIPACAGSKYPEVPDPTGFLARLKAGYSNPRGFDLPASLATALRIAPSGGSYVASTGITSRQPSGRPARFGYRLAGDIETTTA